MFLAIILKEVTMKSKNNTFKKLFQIMAIFVLAILSSLTTFSFDLLPTYSASVENPNFSNNMTTSTNTPATPSSYTFVDSNFKTVSYNPQSTSANQPKLKAGVVDIEEQGYSKPSSSKDDYALMISSKVDDSSYSVKYGYTSTQFTLDAGSCYKISVDIYSDSSAGLASIYLIDEDSSVYADFEHIGRANNWSSYIFYVKVDDLTSRNLKLALFLDGNGTVLFDSVDVQEINEQQLNSEAVSYASNCKVVEQKQDNIISQTAFTKNDFTKVFANNDSTIKTIYENLDGKYSSAVQISNSALTYAQYETDDEFFTFEQNRVYRVTFSAKAQNLSGKITLNFIQTNLDNDTFDTSDEKFTLTISSDTENSTSNDYNNYSFFINSHPLKTTTYKLVVNFGEQDSTASGDLFLAGVTISSTTYSNFDSVSTSDSVKKINLATKIVDVSSDAQALMITNGNFNSVKPTSFEQVYPTTPASWEVSKGTGSQLYGVINTAEFDKFTSSNTFAKTAINPGNPNGLVESNNLLMFYNNSVDTLAYTSEIDKSLTSNTYHRVSLNVLTQNSSFNIYLVTTIDEKEVILSSIKGITTNGDWHNVDLYLYTGIHELSIGVKVEMSTSNGAGFGYIDDVTFDFALRSNKQLSQPTETEFNNITATNQSSTHIAKADLTNLLISESTGRYATPIHFDYTSNDNVDFGIIDLSNYTDVSWVLKDIDQNYNNLTSLTNKNILAIHARNYVNETYTTNIGYRFESNNYYLVSVKVYTQNLTSESDEFGLNLSLSTFDKSFSNINTEVDSTNGWKLYQFYINPSDSTTAKLQIKLGDENALLKGDAFIGDLTVSKIESSMYPSASTDTALILTEIVDNSTDDDTDNDSSDSETNNNSWFIAIPTILTALAIILAVVGFALRKIKFKKPVKKAKTAYDRNSKQSQQIYMRKATTMREEHLLELNKQLETLQSERSKYEEQYKKDLSALRQLKIKRAPANEIAKLEKDMKANQKHTAQIGSAIHSIEMDIEFTKSPEYIKQAIKQLSSAK